MTPKELLAEVARAGGFVWPQTDGKLGFDAPEIAFERLCSRLKKHRDDLVAYLRGLLRPEMDICPAGDSAFMVWKERVASEFLALPPDLQDRFVTVATFLASELKIVDGYWGHVAPLALADVFGVIPSFGQRCGELWH